jgi:hypothetical protein
VDAAYDAIMDLLMHFDQSTPYRLDPSGDEALRLAKRVRRDALREGGAELVVEEAERHFGLPPSASLGYAQALGHALYTAG